MNTVSEKDLVVRAREDLQAFGELVERYRGVICRQCRGAVGDWHYAEDLAQETFVRAYLHLEQLREPERFGPWLRRIAANACKEFARSPARREVPSDALPDRPAPAPPDAEDLPAMLEALPEDLRQCVLLFYEQQQSYEEIAGALGISGHAVRSRLYRAKRMLREEMAEVAPDARSPFTQRVLARLEGLASEDAAARADAARDLHAALAEDRVTRTVEHLRDPDPLERSATIRSAGRQRSPRVRDALVEMLLHDPWEEIRMKAAQALIAQGDPSVIPALRQAADAPDNPREVVAAALSATRQLEKMPGWKSGEPEALRLRSDVRDAAGDPKARREMLQRLRAALSDPAAEVRAQAVKALCELGDRRAAPWIARLLQDPSPGIRQSAAVALGKIGSAQSVPALARVLEQSEDRPLLQPVLLALGEIGDRRAVPALLAAMERTAPRNRAVMVLATDALEKLLVAEDLPQVRGALDRLAALRPELPWPNVWGRLLAAAGDAQWVPETLLVLEQDKSWVVGRLLSALGRIGDPRALDTLQAHLRAGSVDAAYALVGLGDAGLDALVQALQSDEATVREAAARAMFFAGGVEALAGRQDRRAMALLQQVGRSDSSGSVRLMALAALRKLRTASSRSSYLSTGAP